MVDKALRYLRAHPEAAATLSELRRAAGVTMKSQYSLRDQLMGVPGVCHLENGKVSIDPAFPAINRRGPEGRKGGGGG